MSIETLTISVEPEQQNLTDIEVEPISQKTSLLKQFYGNYMFTSLEPDQKIILDYPMHPIFHGFVYAYKFHRPITISPDIIFLLIIQAFSNHVANNSEKLRHKFVNFSGKKTLTVERLDKNFFTMDSKDWNEFFPEFVEKISEFTGKEITEILTPEFTTTTEVSLAVGQLTIMSAMKNYFEYKCVVDGCGIPYITIEGTTNDWIKILNKLSGLAKYEFNWFTEKTIPIIEKIIQTKKGNIDIDFWKKMIRVKDGNDFYDPDQIDGWFVSFFPFSKYGDRVSAPVPIDTEMQAEIQEIPFDLVIRGVGTFHCYFLAGFVGLSQNEKSKSLKPEIGWFIKKEILNDKCNEILESLNIYSRKSIEYVISEMKSLIERHKSDPDVEKILNLCEELKKEAESLPQLDENDDDIIIIDSNENNNENDDLIDDNETIIKDLENKNEEIKDQSIKPKKPSKCCILI